MEHNLDNEKILKYTKTQNGYNIITTNFRMFVQDKNIHKLKKSGESFGKYVKDMGGYKLIEINSENSTKKYYHFPINGYNYSDSETIDRDDDFLNFSTSKLKNIKVVNKESLKRIVDAFKESKNILEMDIVVVEIKDGYKFWFPKGTIYHNNNYKLVK